MKVVAIPVLPHLPVRPILWTERKEAVVLLHQSHMYSATGLLDPLKKSGGQRITQGPHKQ